MMSYQIRFLEDYSDESLLEEIRRVARSNREPSLSLRTFERLSGRVSASTVRRRFGGWRNALKRAGLVHLYGGRHVSEKMKVQMAKRMSNEDLIAEMKSIYSVLGKDALTAADFDRHSAISSAAIRRRLGSWSRALQEAGIAQSEMANKGWSEDECFENLASVWTHLGRQPTFAEMDLPPSAINARAYETRWGTWRRALRAFVAWTHTLGASGPGSEIQASGEKELSYRPAPRDVVERKPQGDQRQVPARLRFRVFARDRFRCVACGRSPATSLDTVLHADHIVPVALGGKTLLENLQTLCQDCNLGKGSSPGH